MAMSPTALVAHRALAAASQGSHEGGGLRCFFFLGLGWMKQALSFFHSHGHGVMGITPSSTTLIRTLCPLVTRDLTTEQDAPCCLNWPSPQMPVNTDGQASNIFNRNKQFSQ
ncbi:hypothetical protein cypCar_00001034 [Cyprinus carpio]|nr:hypothetical protein cypCar_00001034 [Cyprinus carpio]